MVSLFRDFTWGVPKSGFRWAEGTHRPHYLRYVRSGVTFESALGRRASDRNEIQVDEPQPVLVPADPEDQKLASYDFDYDNLTYGKEFSPARHSGRQYSLAETATGLFWSFAELETQDQILDFADKWGALGGDISVAVSLAGSPEEKIITGLSGEKIFYDKQIWSEPLGFWVEEIWQMNAALTLLDLAKNAHPNQHEAKIDYTSYGTFLTPPENGPFNNQPYGNFAVPIKTEDDITVETAAKAVLTDFVSAALRGRVNIGLDLQREALEATARPVSLIGALWLQLLFAVHSETNFRRCDSCRTWFEIGTESGRKDKKYCSDACRMRSYRQRKARL